MKARYEDDDDSLRELYEAVKRERVKRMAISDQPNTLGVIEEEERFEEFVKNFKREMQPAHELAFEALAAEIPEGYGGQPGELARGRIVRWNDHPETTDADVFAAFERAIAKLSEAAG
jgi:hypothetical protein